MSLGSSIGFHSAALILIAALILVAMGCGAPDDEHATPSQPAPSDDEGKAADEAEAAESQGDLPIYPDAELHSMDEESDAALYGTDAPAEVVAEFYRRSFDGEGWRVESIPGMIVATKDHRVVTILIDDSGERTEVVVSREGAR